MTDPTDEKKRSYKQTLNLPKTAFAMKANLVQNEPASLKRWQDGGLYRAIRAARKGSSKYVFHDGPPYANGSIHLGHLLNKCLKDFVVRSRTMMGFDCPYIPGWDCHGLPIEHKVMQELGEKAKTMEAYQVRRKCQAYAEKFVKLQGGQMQRLLTLADYDHPYLTMDPAYEAASLEVFAQLVEKGLVYRALKPVHWSIANQTALAEAELEYEDRKDTSIYVLFDVTTPTPLHEPAKLGPNAPVQLMIWTTTPWTLPANLAVAAAPRALYGLFKCEWQGRTHHVILADDLADKVLATGGATDVQRLATCKGEELHKAGVRYRHPFIDRVSPVVTADYVTLEDGTGLVHTAPGHGVEDYQTGLREKLDIYCPVLADGTFDHTAPDWLQGIVVWDANAKVLEKLTASNHLFHAHRFTHSYPHDWRSKTPTIFRATEQWFVSVDMEKCDGGRSLRSLSMEHVKNGVKFIPDWGRNRMHGMLESRPDWCISRQRSWGLPIPAFYNKDGEALLTAASVRAVAKVVAQHGSDAWFKLTPEELLKDYDPQIDPDAPAWAKAEGWPSLGFTKGADIFDVWFDSGTSWASVIRQRFGADALPTDLYLEGSDQHRGWFQASLLPAVATTGKPPYKAILTHGFMVDRDGRKMSKSLGNALEVETLLKDYGADVCRWWVSSLPFENDIKVDIEFFKTAGEEYRKVRNTVRFLLSNLYDYTPANAHAFTDADSTSLDAWALGELNKLIATVVDGYENHHYRRLHEALFNFCNDTLSAVYLAATKDRLYCDAPGSVRRRRTQTAMFTITDALVRLLAPILPHTADEARRALHGENATSVHLETFPTATGAKVSPAWGSVMPLREEWMRAIEQARIEQSIDNPLDMGLSVTVVKDQVDLSSFDPTDLADLCMVSRFVVTPGTTPACTVHDLRSEPRCERSWKRDGSVRERADGGMLSDRDAAALGLA
ncbi:MAG: isoleucine--tRNA ligase [Phycisphaera sp.]|nr:isoleucine--tRNA ligase [Phycisphaera sp.]